MTTRFYLPSTGTPSISPAFGAGWEVTTNADRRTMVTTRISSAMTTKDGAGTLNDAEEQLLRQYISSPLGAQTLSGTIKGQVRCTQNLGDGAFALAIRVAKCNSDGSSVTEILAVTYTATGVDTKPPWFVASLTNRRFEEGTDDFNLNLASTGISAGDFLIVEIGVADRNNTVERFGQISFGDDSGTDLAEDETTTAANNPWVEFSADIVFDGGAAVPKRLLLLGVG